MRERIVCIYIHIVRQRLFSDYLAFRRNTLLVLILLEASFIFLIEYELFAQSSM